MYDWLEDQYGVIRDMFPYPRPAGYDALKAAFPVDACAYINSDFLDGAPLVGAARKCVAEAQLGKRVVMVAPCPPHIQTLLTVGFNLRMVPDDLPFVKPHGRARWLHCETGEPMRSPPNVALFESPAAMHHDHN